MRLRQAITLQLTLEGEPALRLEAIDACRAKLRCTHAPLAHALAELDSFAMESVSEHCAAWFGKALPRAQLDNMIRPSLSAADGGWALDLRRSKTLRAWSLLGPGVCCRAPASSLRPGAALSVCAELSGLYFLPRHFGLVLTLTDVMLLPPQEPIACPFVSADGEPLRTEEPEDLLPEEVGEEAMV